jgi:hypothetical protein
LLTKEFRGLPVTNTLEARCLTGVLVIRMVTKQN